MKNKFFFKTAEFARLCNTSKDTLIHYDEIGLFKPQYVGENKYRYYSFKQIDEYHTIAALRDVGFSLQHIKEKLHDSSMEMYCKLIEEQQSVVSEKITALERTAFFISTHLAQVKEYIGYEAAMCATKDKVIIKEFPERHIVSMPCSVKLDDGYKFVELYSDFATTVKNTTKSFYYPCGAIVERLLVETKKSYFFTHLYFQIDEQNATDTISKGQYLVTYEKTDFDNIVPAYERLVEYADKENLKIDSHFYEDIVMSHLNSEKEKYVVQISCRIL